MGRTAGVPNKPKIVCEDCQTRHLAGAPCGIPPADTRLSLPDSYRLNVLEQRIHGLHEVFLDLHYNPDFAALFGTAAKKAIERLEVAYQREYDECAANLKNEGAA
jgi:hypothetical protein